MLAINHTLTAVALAVSIQNPAVVVPLAFVSHFMLDIIPHYGEDPKRYRGTPVYYYKVVADGLISIAILVIACMHWPNLRGVISLAVFFSVLPDLLWPLALVIKKSGPLWEFFKFHKGIQHESPAGITTEIIWALLFSSLLIAY
jgi:hypothetical protein